MALHRLFRSLIPIANGETLAAVGITVILLRSATATAGDQRA